MMEAELQQILAQVSHLQQRRKVSKNLINTSNLSGLIDLLIDLMNS